MGILERIAAAQGRGEPESRSSIDMWIDQYLRPANQFSYGGAAYPFGGVNQTWAQSRIREVANTLPGYSAALRGCPPAFAAQAVRATVLSQARFKFRNNDTSPTPQRLFGTRALQLLERPWPKATTGQLIARMEWHVGLTGNAYVTRQSGRSAGDPGRLRVLRPDWMAILFGSQREPEDPKLAVDGEVIGYVYVNGGFGGLNKPTTLLPDEVAHWSPLPDPDQAEVGMSWITPAVRDLQADGAATEHKLNFFRNGAPQPLDARILTPVGWSTMGEMRPGQLVIGADGKPHEVTAVYPQGERDIYRVTFTGGVTVECTDDHLWSVASYADRKAGTRRTMTLAQIVAAGVRYDGGSAKWSVPLVEPVEFESVGGLPVRPYLLGSLLGDGYMKGNVRGSGAATLACHVGDADEQAALVGPLLPAGNRIARRERSFRAGSWVELNFASAPGPKPNPLTEGLKELGVWGVVGVDKQVPERYLRASVSDRVALLQGLIDTDGSVEKQQPNTVRFAGTSERLCRQVGELVGGLGGKAQVRPSRKAGDGVRPQWTVTISRLPEWIIPCRLSRKAARYRSTLHGGRYRYIQSVEYVGRKPAQCIAVDSDDHLYVTDGFVLTHNTPNMVVKGITAPTQEHFEAIVDMMEERHRGVENAYRTLYLTAGADATVVGSNLAELDLSNVQGGSETRITYLSRVPASLLGIGTGLKGSSLNAGNFAETRRSFSDTWLYPTLQDLCAALAPLIDVPGDAELWFSTKDMPVLREDARDAADIAQIQATTITTYVKEGFTWESAVAAVLANDLTLLKHTGLTSVQLHQPGSAPSGPGQQPAAEPQPAGRPAVRKFNPAEPRRPDGKWGSGGGSVRDVLRLADRIQLGRDERFAGSAKVSDATGDFTAVMARVDGPHGPTLRLGLVVPEDARKWRAANRGNTVLLNESETQRLRDVVSTAAKRGSESVAKYKAEIQRVHRDRLPRERWPDSEERIAHGVFSSPWGDLSWSLTREEWSSLTVGGTEYPGSNWVFTLDGPDPALDGFHVDSPSALRKFENSLVDLMGAGNG